MSISNNYNLQKNLIQEITKFNVIINLPNQSNQIVIRNLFFLLKMCLYIFAMSFFIIMWSDGLVVKAMECGREG